MCRDSAWHRRQAAIKRAQAKEDGEAKLDSDVAVEDADSCKFDPSPTPNTPREE